MADLGSLGSLGSERRAIERILRVMQERMSYSIDTDTIIHETINSLLTLQKRHIRETIYELEDACKLTRECADYWVGPNPLDLYHAIAHGDAEHRTWLREAILNFYNDEPVPTPRGSGTKDRLYKDNEKLGAEIEYLKSQLDACQKAKLRLKGADK